MSRGGRFYARASRPTLDLLAALAAQDGASDADLLRLAVIGEARRRVEAGTATPEVRQALAAADLAPDKGPTGRPSPRARKEARP